MASDRKITRKIKGFIRDDIVEGMISKPFRNCEGYGSINYVFYCQNGDMIE